MLKFFTDLRDANILEAKGLPCCFREYEALLDGVWSNVTLRIPEKREFIRYSPQQSDTPPTRTTPDEKQ